MNSSARPWVVAAVIAALASVGAADRIAYQGRLVMGSRGIVVMNADGANPVELPRPAASDAITPALSPDGTQLAYGAKAGDSYKLWIVPLGDDNAPAGEPRQLTGGDANDEQPAWSRDGRRIAYVSSSGDGRALMVVSAAGGTPTAIAAVGSDFRNACPAWSPDGSSIVFGREGKLLIVSSAGGDERELVDDGMYPAWSPDGGLIACFARQPQPALTVISPQTGDRRTVLAAVDFYGEVAWSPDGQALLFKADRVAGQEGSLWVVPAEGGEPRALRTYGVAHGYLDWSRRPTTVAAAPAVPPSEPPTPRYRLVQGAPSAPGAQPARPAAAAAPIKPAKAPAQISPVRLISPAPAAEVRGPTTIMAAKSEPGGYVSFFVNGKFVAATIQPYEFAWDTRAVEDGQHTLSVIGYGPGGQIQGTAEVAVEVRNAIGAETLPQEGVLLRLRFKAKDKWEYEVRVQAQAGARGERPTSEVAAQGGTIQASLAQRVEGVRDVIGADQQPQSVGTIVTQMKHGLIKAPGTEGNLPQVGLATRSTISSAGAVTPLPVPAGGQPIALANLALEFPPDRVKVGDRWTAPMTVLAALRSPAVQKVNAQHRVDGLQWEQGREALRIISTFKVPSLATGISGLTLSEASGTRTTWFAYKEHRILRMEDNIEGTFRQQVTPPTAAPAAPGTPTVTAPPAAVPRMTIGPRRDDDDDDDARSGLGRMLPAPAPAAPGYQPPTAPAQPAASQPTPIVHYTLTLTQSLQ